MNTPNRRARGFLRALFRLFEKAEGWVMQIKVGRFGVGRRNGGGEARAGGPGLDRMADLVRASTVDWSAADSALKSPAAQTKVQTSLRRRNDEAVKALADSWGRPMPQD